MVSRVWGFGSVLLRFTVLVGFGIPVEGTVFRVQILLGPILGHGV